MSTKQSSERICWVQSERISSEPTDLPLMPLRVFSHTSDTASDYKTSQTDALLADRGRIDSSHRMLDDTLK